MGKKIKEIDIEAFRAYEKLQKFDFINEKSKKIADLVVLYAPNGYGKTSFFEAIEWAITDKISRFTTPTIKNEVNLGQGNILKNKNSSCSQGSVKIITENDEIFQRNTKKLTGNMKNDYKPASPENEIPEELKGLLGEKDSFCMTNMLAHDKITSFLQTYTAEDKTKALKSFWDSKGAYEILENIEELFKEIEKEENSLTKEVSKDKKSLQLYKFESNKENELRKLLIDFNSMNTSGQIDLKNVVENFDMVILETSLFSKENNEKRLTNENDLNTLDLLINDFPSFMSIKKDLDSKEKEKVQYIKKMNTFSDVNKLQDEKSQVQNKKLELLKILNSWNEFKAITKAILKISENKKEFSDFCNELKKRLIETNEKISNCEGNIDENTFLLNKEKEDKISFNLELKIYNNNCTNLNKNSRWYEKALYLLNKRKEKRNYLHETINNFETFLVKKDCINLIKDYINVEIVSNFEKILVLEKEENEQKQKIIGLENQYEKTMFLCGKINQLVVQGKALVEDSKSKECPLCHSKFKDFTSLIASIKINSTNNNELDILRNSLNKEKEINSKKNENIDLKKYNFNKSIIIILRNLKEAYKKQNDRIASLKLYLIDKNSLISSIQNQNTKINIKYESKCENLKNANLVQTMESQFSNKIIKFEEIIKKEEDKKNDSFDLLKIIKLKIQNMELDNIELDKKLELLKNNEMYINIINYLKPTSLQLESLNFNEQLVDLNKKITTLIKKIVDIEVKVKEKFLQEKIQESEDQLKAKYDLFLRNSNELLVSYDNYRLRCEKLFKKILIEDIKFEDSNIEILLKKGRVEISNKNCVVIECLNLLNSINTIINSLQTQKIWINNKNEYERKEIELKNISIKKEKLLCTKTKIQEYIVDITNKHFDSKTINQIYKKLDPQPSMSSITFNTVISSKKLKTCIYTSNDQDNDQVSPLLYLSSAQVNLLSISIFLAKVLTEKNNTLDTIFMDDPIQHLDSINLLSFIDLLRTITTSMGRQVIISTHSENFYNLIKMKLDDEYCSSRFIEIGSVGELT
jgi:exonuclease SbcC